MNIKKILMFGGVFVAGLVVGSVATQKIMKKALAEELEDLEAKKEILDKAEIEILSKEKVLNDGLDYINTTIVNAKKATVDEDDHDEISHNATMEPLDIYEEDDDDDRSDTDIIADYMIQKQREQEEKIIESIERNRDVPPRLVSVEEFDQMRWGRKPGYEDYSLISWQWYRNDVLVNDLYREVIPQSDLDKFIGDIDVFGLMRDVDRVDDCVHIVNDRYKLLIEIDEMPIEWVEE